MYTHLNQPNYIELDSTYINNQRWYKAPTQYYPSVTTVLSCIDKPYLNEWKQSLGPELAEIETKRCSDRGSAIHQMAEDYLNNKTVESSEYSQLFNRLTRKLKCINNIRALEIPLYSDRLKLAGRVDCVAEYDGVLSIIDFKTSTNIKTENMIEDYFLQCTAYAIMYSELFDEPIMDIVVIIACEKYSIPLVFKKSIDKYVKPLLDRISLFYETNHDNI